jgi:Delta7-sterol 5-desaturase
MLIVFVLSMIIFTRYLLVAMGYQWIIERWWKAGVTRIAGVRRIRQIKREIGWSFVSSIVFALLSALCYQAYLLGYTKVYLSVSEQPLWYFMVSPFLFLITYETYYYWMHRVMHIPFIFKTVHKVHHASIHPTVFTSFSFHPLEALLQFLFFPLFLFLVPFHVTMLLAVLVILSLSAVINHSGVEVFRKKALTKHLIGSSHHDINHKEFINNFGLYFTWWDKWMKTESKTQTKHTD